MRDDRADSSTVPRPTGVWYWGIEKFVFFVKLCQ